MDDDRWAWIRSGEGVIDRDHPDWDYWEEADRIERWIEDGAPPVDAQPPALPQPPQRTEVPAIALAVSREQAAALLSVSVDYFDAKVMPGLRVVTKGRRILVPVRELEAWLENNAARALRGR